MVGQDLESASGSSDDSNSTAAFSLVKYENPEIIEIDDSASSEKDGESCEEILNSILPPREWEHNGKLWRQSVSASPATRLDVMNLQEQLDLKLQQRQARETGICQVGGRREGVTSSHVFCRSAGSSTLSALTSSYGSQPSTARSGASSC